MALIIKSTVAAKTNTGHPSTFYNKSKPNPVYQTFDQEIKVFVGYMKKRASPGYRKAEEEAYSRPANILFELWNKYEPCVPQKIFQEKMMEMGDFLLDIKEYGLALWQCFSRYLLQFGDVDLQGDLVNTAIFKKIFIPDGFGCENADLTFRALLGKSISAYQEIRKSDPMLQNSLAIDKCINILDFLRLTMQVLLQREQLCWLIYNGTVHVYTICRNLLSLGHSVKVLEYLLWASMCMEICVPLLSVKYLPWRSTLYTAVCQCYFDCKVSNQAEAFARRGLAKINELSNLESMSSGTDSPEKEAAFRHATVKMAIMIFRRSVYETRRKPRGLLRPKTRANLRDAINLPWPRTSSEKLLAEMFEGSAAQFLCILESLNETNRRILQSSPPAPDTEVEILDVYAELFLSAQEILAGGGGRRGSGPKPESAFTALAGVVQGKNLIDMATRGEDGVPISGAIRLVKFAFCYEQWEMFDALAKQVSGYLKNLNAERYAWEEKALELLCKMEKVAVRKQKRTTSLEEEKESQDQGTQLMSTAIGGTGHNLKSGVVEELLHLADCLLSIIHGPFLPSMVDIDMVIDAALFLWGKCKGIFQKYQTGSLENIKYLQKMDSPNKWVYLLDITQQVICWSGISSVDPALTAEIVLRLALILESSAQLHSEEQKMPARETVMKESKTSVTEQGGLHDLGQQGVSRASMLSTSLLNADSLTQLLQARDILEMGLQNISMARQVVVIADGNSITDVTWAKQLPIPTEVPPTPLSGWELSQSQTPHSDLHEELFSPESDGQTTPTEPESDAKEEEEKVDMVKGNSKVTDNLVHDLHMELLLTYHRICLKLSIMTTEEIPVAVPEKPFKRRTCSKIQYRSEQCLADVYVEDYKELLSRCGRSHLSKALLYMQKATLDAELLSQKEIRKILEDAMDSIKKTQNDEYKLYVENLRLRTDPVKPTKIPPPPILLGRSDTVMVLRPSPFQSADGIEVGWYRLFGRAMSGTSTKVRMNDYFLPGTGEEVPSYCSEMRVSGLIPNERYIFAVAAYTKEGKLIGESVGETSRPILASCSLPVLCAWAFLCQISSHLGHYKVSKQAFDVLWGHFVAEAELPQNNTYTTSSEKDFQLTLMKLNRRVVSLTSPILLRQFLTCIFLTVDVAVKEKQLFCDVLCDQGPLYNRQITRLRECEKMLVALELCGWLNESNQSLQAVVQCYGLLAPLIFYKISSPAVIQVLQYCHAVLQEIPMGLRQKRQAHITDSLHHMTACITFHMARVLRTWGEKSLSSSLNETGRKLLAIETSEPIKTEKTDTADKTDKGKDTEDDQDMGELSLQILKSKKKGKKGLSVIKDGEPESPVNEELKALEAHMLSLSMQAQNEHELTGNEDPSILHAYIAYLPSRIAYREVSKFKRRARYLEFFVQVAQKALTEGLAELAVEWCEDTEQWLTKRNEQIIGAKAFLSKQPGVITVTGDDPKRFAAAMVEYSKEKEQASPRGANLLSKTASFPTKPVTKPRRKIKYKPLHVNMNLPEAARHAQEETEAKAVETICIHLPDIYRNYVRRRRLRKICVEELPWRCQLNLVEGLSHFASFLHKLEMQEKLKGNAGNRIFRSSYLDIEWFTFETSGTLVVGWDGNPSRQPTQQALHLEESPKLMAKEGRKGQRTKDRSDMERERTQRTLTTVLDMAVGSERQRATGIEIAAAMATGAAPPPLYTIPDEPEDTPRTYRSDVSTARPHFRQLETTMLLSSKEAIATLTNAFAHLTRAVVMAYRGQQWTALQNATRSMWNCAHTALLRVCSLQSHEDKPISVEELRSVIWQPFFTAADCILDMLVKFDMENYSADWKPSSKTHDSDHFVWMGDATMEKGGASLKFDLPLDDLSIIDARWVRRLILRVLEILYYEGKWEKLVDIALRFNALTNDRYAEQVVPLLVQAQRKLCSLIEQLMGAHPPQPALQHLENELRSIITAKKYLHAQLIVKLHKVKQTPISAGAHIDPVGHGLHNKQESLKTVSVPLDSQVSLLSLWASLSQSQYTSRALQHSRKLMVLYLKGQQNGTEGSLSRQGSKVEFVPTTARPQPTMPQDISHEEFLNEDDIMNCPIPRSQIGTVMSSYEKTIEMLLAKSQHGLAAQAMHELGNLHYHTANIRGAYKWWSESLDLTLGTTDAIHTWRDAFKDEKDIGSALLQKCGLWGCLLGGLLASNIAQYILTSDLGMRMECCFLSGFFFKALFRSSLPHPLADREYALYEVGEGCEVACLIPGVDLLSDRFRCDGRQVVAALRWVTEELSRARHNLFVLPLLTLNLYFTTVVSRDLQRSVDGRILKVRILTDLHLFTEAFVTLQHLLHGERLPHTGGSGFRQVDSRVSQFKFDTSKPITEPANLKLLENVLDKRLSSNLATLYGPHLTCHLSLSMAHLLSYVAKTVPVLPTMEDILIPKGQGSIKPKNTISTVSRGAGCKSLKLSSSPLTDQQSRKSSRSSVSASRKETIEGSEESVGQNTQRFTSSRKPLTFEIIKGTLLAVADQIVSTIAEVIQENAENNRTGLQGLSAAELELVVLCRLEQASIARQRHHSPMAARIVLQALKTLKSSNLFKTKKEHPRFKRPSSMKGKKEPTSLSRSEIKLVESENSQYQYQNFQSRSHLDARLWLECRLALVKSLMLEVRGLGEVKGTENKVLEELSDCRQYCVEGLGEAEACGELEMQAEFLIQGAILNIVEGKTVEHTVSILQEAIRFLRKIVHLSDPGNMLLATTIILKTDLEAIEHVDDSILFTERILDQYLQAQDIILQQMQNRGEIIEHHYPKGLNMHFAAPISPIKDVYLPHVLRLSQVKLRIGHAMTRRTAKSIRSGTDKDAVSLWMDALSVLTTALNISQVSASREASLEAEILLNMGKVQRMLAFMSKFPARDAAATLLEAIKTNVAAEHDLGLIRQAYLEIALVYMNSSGLAQMREGSVLEGLAEVVDSGSGDETASKHSQSRPTSKSSKKKPKSKKGNSRPSSVDEDEKGRRNNERQAAIIAVRCAAAVATCMRNRMLLVGNASVTAQPPSNKAQESIPDFLSLDLVSSYVLGQKKRVYKSEIEEELAPLIEAQEEKHVETYEEQVMKANHAAKDLSWTHFLGYQTILQRLCSTSTLSEARLKVEQQNENTDLGDLGPEFALGFISHAQCDTTLNHDVVRSMLFSGTWNMRLCKLHHFLASHLQGYAADCCAIYPPDALFLMRAITPLSRTSPAVKIYSGNLSSAERDQVVSEQATVSPSPGCQLEPHKPSDKEIIAPVDNEVTLQWYQPSLEESEPGKQESTGQEASILLLYAIQRKMGSAGTARTGLMWVSLSALNDLHDRLAVLTQRSEISLTEKSVKKEPTPTPTPTPTPKAKKGQRIKALSPKVKRDEHLETLLSQCVNDAMKILGVQCEPVEPSVTEILIPFEVIKDNVKIFENLFDSSFGYTAKGTDIVQWLLKQFS